MIEDEIIAVITFMRYRISENREWGTRNGKLNMGVPHKSQNFYILLLLLSEKWGLHPDSLSLAVMTVIR